MQKPLELESHQTQISTDYAIFFNKCWHQYCLPHYEHLSITHQLRNKKSFPLMHHLGFSLKRKNHSLNNHTINTHVNSWTKQVTIPLSWEKTNCKNSHSFVYQTSSPQFRKLAASKTYNHLKLKSKNIINLFGTINKERIFYKSIANLLDYEQHDTKTI